MKKLFLLSIIAVFGMSAVNAQDGQFNLGANLSLPVGDADTAFGLALGVEANYLFDIADGVKVGPSASYLTYLAKSDFKDFLDNVSFLPLAAAGRFAVSDQFSLGADLGYAVGLSPDGNDGGFYYRPVAAYSVSESLAIQLSYSGVSVDGGTFSNIGLGAMFAL
ncbi:outer membrane beta-barrel protein [Algibacter sp.]|nr:outer membrane beta-barrel protein [Algibacter sp.]